MKKLSLVTVVIFILSLVQNIFFPGYANAQETYQSARGIIPTYVGGNDPDYGLPWIKINPNGSYETPDKYTSTITISTVNRVGNTYTINFSNGVTTKLTCKYDSQSKLVSWSSTTPITYAFVKAGDGGLRYDYSKANPVILDDSNLYTPEHKDLSHVNFYFDPKPTESQFGSLKVKKVYEGNGTFPTANFTIKDNAGNTVETFSLSNNQETVVDNLSLNKQYVLYENPIQGYEAYVIDSSSKEVKLTDAGYPFTLSKPALNSIAVPNCETVQLSLVVKNKQLPPPVQYGSLKVKKVYEGNGNFPTANFTIKDKAGNKIKDFTLTNNQETTIDNLELNKEYVLYENPIQGYEAYVVDASSNEVKLTDAGYTFTLSKPTLNSTVVPNCETAQLSLVVKNKQLPPPVQYGSLKVKKVYEGDGNFPTANFTIKDKAGNKIKDFSLTNNQETTIDNLELNKEYVLYENPIQGYEAYVVDASSNEVKLTDAGYTFTLSKPTLNSIAVPNCEAVQLCLVIKNKQLPPPVQYGSLKVKKVYEGNGTFPTANFTIKDKAGNVVKTFSLINNQETIIENLELNKEYVLYENPIQGYEAYVVDASSNEVKLTDSGYSFTLYKPLLNSVAVPNCETVQLSLVVKNKQLPPPVQYGSLKVKKVYEGNGDFPTANFALKDKDGNIVKTFTLTNNQETVIGNLDLNKEYVLYETPIQGYEEYIVNSSSPEVKVTDAGYSFTLTEPAQISLLVENKQLPPPVQYGSLKVKKIYEGDGTYPTANFTLKDKAGNIIKTFALTNNQETVIDNLSLKTDYVLYETPIQGYDAYVIDSSSTEVKLTDAGYTFTLKEPVQLSLVVKNKQLPPPVQYGSLKVKKIYEGDGTYPTANFTLKDKAGNIIKTFALTNNQETVIDNLSLKTDYVLYETPIQGYDAYVVNSAGSEVKLTDAGYTFTLTEPVQLSLIVKNKAVTPPVVYGSIKVKKVYEGDGTYPTANFVLKDKDGNIIKQFSLSNNEEVTIDQLSLNKGYVLYEESMDGYEPYIVDSSSNEIKLTADGYGFTLTDSAQLSIVVKNKKIETTPDQPVINPVTPQQLPKTGSMLGDLLLPLLGIAFILGGVVVFRRSKSYN